MKCRKIGCDRPLMTCHARRRSGCVITPHSTASTGPPEGFWTRIGAVAGVISVLITVGVTQCSPPSTEEFAAPTEVMSTPSTSAAPTTPPDPRVPTGAHLCIKTVDN